MNRFFRFLFGTSVFSFSAERKTEILNLLLEKGIGAISCVTEGDRGTFTVFRRDAERIPDGVCEHIGDFGAYSVLSAFFRRPGLVIGGALAILLLVLSSLTVWRVEITGNERLGAVEIESALAEAGLEVGDFSPSLDIPVIKTRFLQENPEISWIGIYIRGTTVDIEVREVDTRDEKKAATGFCNLVAASDGVVERVSVEAGRAVVVPGATVRAGELLISGIYSTASGLRATRAEGCVFVRSKATVAVHQGFYAEGETYGKSELSEVFLDFFGKKIKLFKKSGKNGAEYDIIKRKEQIVLFEEIALPIFFECYERIPRTVYPVVLSEEDVVREAFLRLRADMALRFGNAEIVSEQIYAEWTETGYSLTCLVEYVSDVAVPLPYDAEINGG